MKKLLIVVISFALLMCCKPQSHNETSSSQKETDVEVHRIMSINNSPSGISIIVIDNCEYIYCERSNGGLAIIHKENCKNLNHSIK